MNPRSIRFRLTIWHACLLTAVFVVLGTLLYIQLGNYLEDTFLDTQSRRAQQIGATLTLRAPNLDPEGIARELTSIYAPEHSNRFIRITRDNGSLLYISGPPNDQSFDPREVPPVEPSPRREFTRKQEMPGGPPLLIAASKVATPGSGSFLVETGVSAAPIETMLSRLLVLLSFGLPVVVLVAAGGGYLLVRRSLRPVDEIANKADIITQHNLSESLPVTHTGDELERLSISLNRMIVRLDDAFQNSKRFVADASHELRTPLTILRGELESLAQEERIPAPERERLGSLLEEAERLSKIVERLFALSRLDAGEARTQWVEFDLADLAAVTVEQMRLLAEDRKISLSCESVEKVHIGGDRARMKQVVVNLLDNAIKYTSEGGAVRLKVSVSGPCAVLEVTDTGVGIHPDDLPHIFGRFYRADKTRSRQPDGAGLGLAIVKSICNAHGGEVEVESAVGRGTRILAKFPLVSRTTGPFRSG
jgi:heavy metal sensor kinase